MVKITSSIKFSLSPVSVPTIPKTGFSFKLVLLNLLRSGKQNGFSSLQLFSITVLAQFPVHQARMEQFLNIFVS